MLLLGIAPEHVGINLTAAVVGGWVGLMMGMMMQVVELCAVRPQVVWTMFLVLASRQLDWLGSIVLPVAPLEMCEQLLAVVGMVDEKLKAKRK